MAWLILKTEPAKEQRVAINLQGIFECYLPMEARSYRHGLHRCRAIKEVPIIPRLVFVYRQFVHGLQDIIGHKYVLGLARDTQGDVFVIPDYQMAHFQETVSQWRLDVLQAHAKQTAKKFKRPKLHSFEDLAKYLEGLAILNEAA